MRRTACASLAVCESKVAGEAVTAATHQHNEQLLGQVTLQECTKIKFLIAL